MRGHRTKSDAVLTYTTTVATPLGPMIAAAEDDFLTGLWFVDQKHRPVADQWIVRKNHPVFRWLQVYLKCYFAAKVGNHDFPLAPQGTRLEMVVWQVLGTIPYGRILTLPSLVREVTASPAMSDFSSREIRDAVRRTPISILIPSHRVLCASGALEGFAGGAQRKEALLALEGVLGAGSSCYCHPHSQPPCTPAHPSRCEA